MSDSSEWSQVESTALSLAKGPDAQQLLRAAGWIGALPHFDVGKFPEPRVDHVGRALHSQPFAFVFQQERLEKARGWRKPAAQVRELLRMSARPRVAILLKRTAHTLWLARQT